MIASSELATARRWLIPIAQTSPGTRTTPPPTPNRPLTKPAIVPTPSSLAKGLPVGPGMATRSHAEHLAVNDEIGRRSPVDGAYERTRRHRADATGTNHPDVVEAVGGIPVGEVEGRQGAALSGIVGRAEVALDLAQGVGWRVPGVQRTDVVVVDDPRQVRRRARVVAATPFGARALRMAAIARREDGVDELAAERDALEVSGGDGGILSRGLPVKPAVDLGTRGVVDVIETATKVVQRVGAGGHHLCRDAVQRPARRYLGDALQVALQLHVVDHLEAAAAVHPRLAAVASVAAADLEGARTARH